MNFKIAIMYVQVFKEDVNNPLVKYMKMQTVERYDENSSRHENGNIITKENPN